LPQTTINRAINDLRKRVNACISAVCEKKIKNVRTPQGGFFWLTLYIKGLSGYYYCCCSGELQPEAHCWRTAGSSWPTVNVWQRTASWSA